MKEIVENVLEKLDFENKDKLAELLYKMLEVVRKDEDDPNPEIKEILIKFNVFFKGFSPWINTYGKDKKYESGVTFLHVLLEEMGFDIEKSDCFILFHLREQGKFKIKETKLHDELKSIWGSYKEYKLEDRDFSYSLKCLMRDKLIHYRKGSVQMKQVLLVRLIEE